LEHPPAILRMVSDAQREGKLTFAAAWRKIAEQFDREDAERNREFNEKQFTRFELFRAAGPEGWQVGGQGLRGEFSRSGDFAIPSVSPKAISAILPAGAYTHVLSERLNGTLRSPNLTAAKKYISFQVLGDRAAAVRLVS